MLSRLAIYQIALHVVLDNILILGFPCYNEKKSYPGGNRLSFLFMHNSIRRERKMTDQSPFPNKQTEKERRKRKKQAKKSAAFLS